MTSLGTRQSRSRVIDQLTLDSIRMDGYVLIRQHKKITNNDKQHANDDINNNQRWIPLNTECENYPSAEKLKRNNNGTRNSQRPTSRFVV